jgi:hypothetical protein
VVSSQSIEVIRICANKLAAFIINWKLSLYSYSWMFEASGGELLPFGEMLLSSFKLECLMY